MAQNRHSARHKSAADISVDELAVRLVGGVVQSIAEMMDDSKGPLEKEAWLWRVLAINCEANARFAEDLAKGADKIFAMKAVKEFLMTSDLASMRQFVQRANIEHYHKILRTYLTDQERLFVERRIAEEEAAFQKAAAGSATIGSSVRVL